MSDFSPTLRALIELGFAEVNSNFGMPTVGYDLPHLPLTCSDATSMYFLDVVLVTGILNTGRTLGYIESQIPPDLTTKEAAAAWLTYVLRSDIRHFHPLPEWILLGQANQNLIPFVANRAAEDEAYLKRPHCVIDRDFARILRDRVAAQVAELNQDLTMEIGFDGTVLVFNIAEHMITIPAEGNAWSGYIEVYAIAGFKFPKRFMSSNVVVGYWKDALQVCNHRYQARWVESTLS